ncbi:MAG: NAD(P)-dependent oxidoreductase [Flavobacteriales bacterium]|nr:NAD(P)-dependent oxidoreductase [Flavobacteriales bacterium]
MTQTLKDKTVFITGGSRGIGLAIALKLASKGANIVIAAKTDKPHPLLPGTIYTAAEQIEKAGGKALPVLCDIRFEHHVDHAISMALDQFKSIDILINNASAMAISTTKRLSMKAFDLMHQVNGRGTYMVSQKCMPYLQHSINPHILTIAPPINLSKKWFSPHLAYVMAKYAMSMSVLGLSQDGKDDNIAVNALWPQTYIATSAIKNLIGAPANLINRCRSPKIVADAAYCILKEASDICTGNFFIDEEVLRKVGLTNFDHYAIDLSQKLKKDMFL